jgi:hypothetical protein
LIVKAAQQEMPISPFLTVYRPFSTVLSGSPIRDSPEESGVAPFSGPLEPLINGENGSAART